MQWLCCSVAECEQALLKTHSPACTFICAKHSQHLQVNYSILFNLELPFGHGKVNLDCNRVLSVLHIMVAQAYCFTLDTVHAGGDFSSLGQM